jgi:hypothetical protein
VGEVLLCFSCRSPEPDASELKLVLDVLASCLSGAVLITEEDGSLEEVGGAVRLVKDWTGVGGVCLASFLETYR